jgi:hypothetical protein
LGDLAVEDPEGIDLKPPSAVFAKASFPITKEAENGLFEGRPAGAATQGVDLKVQLP